MATLKAILVFAPVALPRWYGMHKRMGKRMSNSVILGSLLAGWLIDRYRSDWEGRG